MKLFFAIVIALAFINISCTNRTYRDQKQPATTMSEEQPQTPPAPAPDTTQQTASSTSNQSQYEYPDDNGIGPIKNVKLGAIDPKLVAEGKKIFETKCVACHRLDSKLVGPALGQVAKKNTPEFIMNYLLNTQVMQKKDPILEKLVKEFNGVIMPDQGLTQEQARAMVDFFRSVASSN
jgi:cytochrome c551/c552